ncbi:MAG: hypothetical protein KF894_02365 [Labilithrix sp.]|nr:hypothetical protein [Labilithrix sp.]
MFTCITSIRAFPIITLGLGLLLGGCASPTDDADLAAEAEEDDDAIEAETDSVSQAIPIAAPMMGFAGGCAGCIGGAGFGGLGFGGLGGGGLGFGGVAVEESGFAESGFAESGFVGGADVGLAGGCAGFGCGL